jgi:hypothetical protein
MGPEQQRLTSLDRSNLVAYLDGELPEPDAQALATKLTQSIGGRRELESLQRAWELLDYLLRPSASPDFTSLTLSLATNRPALDDRLADVAQRTARGLLRAAICLLVAVATLFASYAATRWLWPDPTARLARDLSIAEHLDAYREVGTFEFLQQIDKSPEFNNLGVASPGAAPARPEP